MLEIDSVHKLMSEGRLPEAEKRVRRILAAEPHHPDALHALAIICSRRGSGTASLSLCEQLVNLRPESAMFWNTRGVVLRSLDRDAEALASYDAAIARNPLYAEAHQNRGNILSDAGQLAEALASHRRAALANPGNFRNKLLVINLLKMLGRGREALPLWEEVARMAPAETDTWLQGGSLFFSLHRFQEAYDCWSKAHAMVPDQEELLADLALLCKKLGRWTEAQQKAEQALVLNAESAWSQLIYLIVALPMVREASVATSSELDLFGERLSALQNWVQGASRRGADLIPCLTRLAPFDIAYCPGNHRSMLSAYGDFVAEVVAGFLPYAPVGEEKRTSRNRIRLGVVSTHICRHSVWDIVTKGLVRHLDRSRFELFIYMLGGGRDTETDWAREHADGWRDVSQYGQDPAQWMNVLHEDAPDVLFYPELGMNGLSYMLAATRIAPVQAAGWGHPITSGLATIDLFFSAELFEPPTAQEHYREKLVLLPGTGCCTDGSDLQAESAPELESLLDGIRGIRLLLPQAPFKMHPAGDGLLVEIAQACPAARFIFLRDTMFDAITGTVVDRVRRAFEQAGIKSEEHLFVIPWQPAAAFSRLLDLADICLDWPAFSGYTTAWHATHRGLPIVTMEGDGMRQRLAAGLLRKIDAMETIASSADQYVSIAAALAEECRNPDSRNTRRHALQAAATRLDNDVNVVRAFEQSLINLLDNKSSGSLHTAGLQMASVADDMTATTPTCQQTEEIRMVQNRSNDSVVKGQPVQNPAWTQLDGDLHLHTLRHDYAPVGLLEMIPAAERVLDVGCFCGGTGKWLKQKFPHSKVIGVEMLEKAAEIAAPFYDNIIVGRFEDVDFMQSGIEAGSMDTIVTADFLEHLVNPWKALQRLRQLMRSDGALYASIPNARNLNVLANLAGGSWNYDGAGIQDVTHLRFFTRMSLLQMFAETGWIVDEIRVNPDSRLSPMVQGRDLATITTINAGLLTLQNLSKEDVLELLTLQFFVRARPTR